MHIPRYWAKGEFEGVTRFFWSDSSAADAKARAVELARVMVAKFKQGLLPPKNPQNEIYGYGRGPLREEVLADVSGKSGEQNAVITRNSMGCKVLNCADTVFVDIDFKTESAPADLGGLFKSLFGRKSAPRPDHTKEAALGRIEQAVTRSGAAARVYNTAAGLRVLFTHEELRADNSQVQQWFTELDADPLYVKLCKSQDSFRARLTPKHFRCDMYESPPRWPYENQEQQLAFASWLKKYESLTADYATCSLEVTFGSEKVTPKIAKIVQLHDEVARVGSDLPLA